MGRPQRKHWYFVAIYYCPACNSTEIYRERRYDPRPVLWEDRHSYEEVYDQCG